jgi:hypothetical protein
VVRGTDETLQVRRTGNVSKYFALQLGNAPAKLNAHFFVKIKKSEENISRKCTQRIRLLQRFLRSLELLLKMLTVSRSAILATVLSFAALPILASTNSGPGGGIPSPIGRIASGPGGGIPSPIGRIAFGPGGGIPSPIGRIASGPGGGIPSPIGRIASGPGGGIPSPIGRIASGPGGGIPSPIGRMME